MPARKDVVMLMVGWGDPNPRIEYARTTMPERMKIESPRPRAQRTARSTRPRNRRLFFEFSIMNARLRREPPNMVRHVPARLIRTRKTIRTQRRPRLGSSPRSGSLSSFLDVCTALCISNRIEVFSAFLINIQSCGDTTITNVLIGNSAILRSTLSYV